MVQVDNNTPISIRFKFIKVGRLQYVSHLDLVRTMMKVIVRAKLPLKYTEGFNPKPKVTFAAPLSTGTESVCEFMDIRLSEKIPAEEALRRMNENLTDELRVTEAYYPENKLTELGWLGYHMEISVPNATAALAEQINSLFSAEELVIMKKGKSGERPTDIKPFIREACAKYKSGNIELDCILSSSPEKFLSPENVIKLLKEKLGILKSDNLLDEAYSIKRNSAYFADMTRFR